MNKRTVHSSRAMEFVSQCICKQINFIYLFIFQEQYFILLSFNFNIFVFLSFDSFQVCEREEDLYCSSISEDKYYQILFGGSRVRVTWRRRWNVLYAALGICYACHFFVGTNVHTCLYLPIHLTYGSTCLQTCCVHVHSLCTFFAWDQPTTTLHALIYFNAMQLLNAAFYAISQ
ncbi:uncharacterized protein LOC143427160 [Xylocopa sonorina]|uniref:uncharacterized protein LOC143427160 n=1 Tax=Xylocopa sonorina TaxID=1818115 RepID=UPI00403B37BD